MPYYDFNIESFLTNLVFWTYPQYKMDTYSHWQRRKPSEWLYPLTSSIYPSGILGVGILHKCISWWFFNKTTLQIQWLNIKMFGITYIYIYICIINNDMKLNITVSKNTLLVSAIIMCSFFFTRWSDGWKTSCIHFFIVSWCSLESNLLCIHAI